MKADTYFLLSIFYYAYYVHIFFARKTLCPAFDQTIKSFILYKFCRIVAYTSKLWYVLLIKILIIYHHHVIFVFRTHSISFCFDRYFETMNFLPPIFLRAIYLSTPLFVFSLEFYPYILTLDSCRTTIYQTACCFFFSPFSLSIFLPAMFFEASSLITPGRR